MAPDSGPRILGAVPALRPTPPPESIQRTQIALPDLPELLECPICGEDMISLPQLNQHLDDRHGPEQSEAPKRRTLSLDMHDLSHAFGLSDASRGDHANSESQGTGKLSRKHWKRPDPGRKVSCTAPECPKILSVKTGVVNCRRCGDLFCNSHCLRRARLINSPHGNPEYSPRSGVLVRVCESCFAGRPAATDPDAQPPMSRDIMPQFSSLRGEAAARRRANRGATQRRYIKLADLFAQRLAWHRSTGGAIRLWARTPFAELAPFLAEKMLELEKDIVGIDNWQLDSDTTHCPLCYVAFSIWVRKHHCRLCGRIVSDYFYKDLVALNDISRLCSVQVPLGAILTKLPGLNYLPRVRLLWDELVKIEDEQYSFRCCRECKNDLLFETRRLQHVNGHDSNAENTFLTAMYESMLAIKAGVGILLPRYRALVAENSDLDNEQANQLRERLRNSVKDFERVTAEFRKRAFTNEGGTLKVKVGGTDANIASTIHKFAVTFLQDLILEVKLVNEQFQRNEDLRLLKQLENSSTTVIEETPRLTKKQIREMRELLMVLNEQSFLVAQQLETARKSRKFDIVETLLENEEELKRQIAMVEAELGEFAFS